MIQGKHMQCTAREIRVGMPTVETAAQTCLGKGVTQAPLTMKLQCSQRTTANEAKWKLGMALSLAYASSCECHHS